MKDRTFSKWLIVFVGVIAIMGFCFTPALAEDQIAPNRAPDGYEDGEPLDLPPEAFDESFGPTYQVTWIPHSSFHPASNLVQYNRSGNEAYIVSGSPDQWLFASINLPSGAFLLNAYLFYYDTSAANISAYIYRYFFGNFLQDMTWSGSSSGTPGWNYAYIPMNETIRNGDRIYTVYVGGGATGTNLGFMGIRLDWRRQIRTGLSHPFTDIGGLSSEFQNSIAALYASGITTGTSSTTFSPNNAVTRGQFATFFARALGLHWAYPY